MDWTLIGIVVGAFAVCCVAGWLLSHLFGDLFDFAGTPTDEETNMMLATTCILLSTH